MLNDSSSDLNINPTTWINIPSFNFHEWKEKKPRSS